MSRLGDEEIINLHRPPGGQSLGPLSNPVRSVSAMWGP